MAVRHGVWRSLPRKMRRSEGRGSVVGRGGVIAR
jgi:hypothetical protein